LLRIRTRKPWSERFLGKFNYSELWVYSLTVQKFPLLNQKTCLEISDRVRSLQEHWINRGGYFAYPFFSLGAASYMDAHEDPERYYTWAAKYNPILKDNFADLYDEAQTFLEDKFNCKFLYHDGFALPGFHIFVGDEIFEIAVASRHCDLQHQLLDWNGLQFNPEESLSFTLYLELPLNGGGMYTWDYHYDDLKNLDSEERKNKLDNSEPTYKKFAIGDLVLHDGLHYHQIAPMFELAENDMRISFQGHAIKSAGTYHLYW
jgi:hypothetical protein